MMGVSERTIRASIKTLTGSPGVKLTVRSVHNNTNANEIILFLMKRFCSAFLFKMN